ncbi:DUF4386 domain-containing protein [Actinophytocola sp.]|uniref:DUF4386 domain-containing protein n=1 Tax=Actinophytocola sp. TaxID=1872138 RepID=UPI002ED3B0FF
MSPKSIGRVMGALFLLAFVAYLTGGAMVEAARHVSTGALLMLVNSAAVVGIGVLALPVLRRHHEVSAYAYVTGRAIEAVSLAVGVVFLLLLVPIAEEHRSAGPDDTIFPALGRIAREGNDYAYQIAMIAAAVAGVLFCRVLLRARLVPRFMAIWGLVGYVVFLAGSMLEVVGQPVGLVLSIPGGLFEVGLGLLLVVKGFPASSASHEAARPVPA